VTAGLEGASPKSGTEHPRNEAYCISIDNVGEVQKVCQFKRHTSLSEPHSIIFVRFQSYHPGIRLSKTT